MTTQILIISILMLMPLSFMIYGINEVIEEIKFARKGIKTKGKVIGRISAKTGSTEYYNSYGTTSFTEEGRPGYLLMFEYLVNGEVWQAKTKKAYNSKINEVEVIYNPTDPSDIMIDKFYKVGKEKYFRILLGLFFSLFFLYPIFNNS